MRDTQRRERHEQTESDTTVEQRIVHCIVGLLVIATGCMVAIVGYALWLVGGISLVGIFVGILLLITMIPYWIGRVVIEY